MSRFSDLGVDRVLDEMRSFIEKPRSDRTSGKDIDMFRELMDAVTDLAYGHDETASVVCEVYDARREAIKSVRIPHQHLIRDPHGINGVSLAEAMASIELMALTASEGVRAVAAEVASQEREREAMSRHVALCEPIRLWGENICEDKPHLSRLLIRFATEAAAPRLIEASDAVYLGFGADHFHQLLDPENIDDLRACLIEMARTRISKS